MNERLARFAGIAGFAGIAALASACGGGLSVRHFHGGDIGNLSNRVLSVAIGPRGSVWLGTDNGLAHRQGGAVSTWWKSWEVTAAAAAKPNIGYFGVSLLTKAGNSPKLGQEARVYQGRARDDQIVETQVGQAFLGDRVTAVLYTKAGLIIAALRDRGVYFHDKDTDQLQEYVPLSALGAAPTCLAEAPDGSLWIGTFGAGVHHVKDRKVIATYTPKNSGLRGDGVVRSVAVHPTKGVFVATAEKQPIAVKGNELPPTRGTGITIFGAGKWAPLLAETGKLVSNDVTKVAVSSTGAVWFATQGGTGASILLPDGSWLQPNVASVNANDVATQGNFGWVGTNNGATAVSY